jgi:hypothetical protein
VKKVIAGLLAGLVLGTAGFAQAHDPTGEIAALKRQVKILKSRNSFLRDQNHRATAAIADFKRQLIEANGEQTRLSGEVTRLQNALTVTTQDRDAARAAIPNARAEGVNAGRAEAWGQFPAGFFFVVKGNGGAAPPTKFDPPMIPGVCWFVRAGWATRFYSDWCY